MKSKEEIIVGIDPGTHNLGFGCIRKNGNTYQLIHAEVISAPRKLDLQARLGVIYPKLKESIARYAPNSIALEDVFNAKNPRSAFHVGLARGLVFAIAIEMKVPLFEYAPTRVKSSVTGYGRADKEQVKKMTEILLGSSIPLRHDATDALAIALCHASESRLQSHF